MMRATPSSHMSKELGLRRLDARVAWQAHYHTTPECDEARKEMLAVFTRYTVQRVYMKRETDEDTSLFFLMYS